VQAIQDMRVGIVFPGFKRPSFRLLIMKRR